MYATSGSFVADKVQPAVLYPFIPTTICTTYCTTQTLVFVDCFTELKQMSYEGVRRKPWTVAIRRIASSEADDDRLLQYLPRAIGFVELVNALRTVSFRTVSFRTKANQLLS